MLLPGCEGFDTSLPWAVDLVGVGVCPGARIACVIRLLLVPIPELDLSRGWAADLGTSRWQSCVADCGFGCQPTECRRRVSRAKRPEVRTLPRSRV
jgi:hypothetical protein